MKIHFTKYHGTGNDFIMIDDRNEVFDVLDIKLISAMCSRRFGIGGDGLILLRNHKDYDFEMVYFNSDGKQSSMCGNGGRCLVQFANALGVFSDKCKFIAIDGEHLGKVKADGTISLQMGNVHMMSKDGSDYILDTGSPHYVKCVDNAFDIDVKAEGSAIRYSEEYKAEGINVNFINVENNMLNVTTYERGVEDETYSCGTGVTACALVAHGVFDLASPISIKTKGGDLAVYFRKTENGFNDIWLEGPAVSVFDGVWSVG